MCSDSYLRKVTVFDVQRIDYRKQIWNLREKVIFYHSSQGERWLQLVLEKSYWDNEKWSHLGHILKAKVDIFSDGLGVEHKKKIKIKRSPLILFKFLNNSTTF